MPKAIADLYLHPAARKVISPYKFRRITGNRERSAVFNTRVDRHAGLKGHVEKQGPVLSKLVMSTAIDFGLKNGNEALVFSNEHLRKRIGRVEPIALRDGEPWESSCQCY